MKRLITSFWFTLFISALLFVLMAVFLPIHFEENDDVVMCLIANGGFSGYPDGHLVFINGLYGWLLAGLYGLTKVVEWYTLSFCVLHVLSMAIMFLIVLKNDNIHVVIKILVILFLCVFWSRIIVNFQFTTTAELVCFSGCMALMQSEHKWRVVSVVAIFIASIPNLMA